MRERFVECSGLCNSSSIMPPWWPPTSRLVCLFLWPRKLRYQDHCSSVRPFNRQTVSSYLVSTCIWHMQVWPHMKLVKPITQLLHLFSVQTVLFKENDGRTKILGLQNSWSHKHTLVFLIKAFAWKLFYFVLHLKIIFHGLYFFP